MTIAGKTRRLEAFGDRGAGRKEASGGKIGREGWGRGDWGLEDFGAEGLRPRNLLLEVGTLKC